MQTNKRAKKSGVNRPAVRSLKIQPKYRVDSWRDASVAPEIKLCGAWLEQLGFHCGKRVTVTTMKEVLIITLQSDESSSQWSYWLFMLSHSVIYSLLLLAIKA